VNRRILTILPFALIVLLVILGLTQRSGPSDAVVAADRRPSTTTTTEPLPEGVFTIKISNGAFSPAVHELDLNEFQIVRWENLDDVTYVVTARGFQTIPGLVDTRPAQ
jgi:hypothetical protein